MDDSFQHKYATDRFRPIITDVQETSISVKWYKPDLALTGGTPINGYKLYLYEGIAANTKAIPEPARNEVQHIILKGEIEEIRGTFTINFRGFESSHIPVQSTPFDIKNAIENMPSINIISVDLIPSGWAVSFLSEAGDVPMMKVTTGRLKGPQGTTVYVIEHVKGYFTNMVYDGSEDPNTRQYTVTNLVPETSYAFKVAPLNAVGDGILSLASITAISRAGASPLQTTASGSAISRGIVGSVREEQVIAFFSNDCESDKLILSFQGHKANKNLCKSSAIEFKTVLENIPGVGEIHVSRENRNSKTGSQGFVWTVTFISFWGDAPSFIIDLAQIHNGKDASDRGDNQSTFVSEFLKGQANEFTIEPKKVSGAVIRDISISSEERGKDIFLTELLFMGHHISSGRK